MMDFYIRRNRWTKNLKKQIDLTIDVLGLCDAGTDGEQTEMRPFFSYVNH